MLKKKFWERGEYAHLKRINSKVYQSKYKTHKRRTEHQAQERVEIHVIMIQSSMQNCCACQRKRAKTPKSNEDSNAGSWSLDQNLEYAIFIDINKKSMTSKKKMRQMEFYDKLSMFVVTRTSSQCRSHHQKLFEKYKYISKTIEAFKKQIPLSSYKTRLSEGVEKMKRINHAAQQRIRQEGPMPPQDQANFAGNPQLMHPSEVHYPFLNSTAAMPMPYIVPQPAWVPMTMPPYPMMPGFWPQ